MLKPNELFQGTTASPCSLAPAPSDLPKIAVLLCSHAPQSLHLHRWLSETMPEVEVHVVSELCHRPEEIGKVVQTNAVFRLVLGFCSPAYAVGEVQRQVRKVGLDALGVETVNLRNQQVEKTKILLAAAVARAQAFTGSRPEHAKLYLATHFSRRSLFKLSLPEYRAAPSITESLCAADLGCKACVEVCPQAALEWSDGRIHYDKNTCEPCGLCVTTCPRGAIHNPALTPSQLAAQISTLLDPTIGNIQPRGIVFTCQHTPEPEEPWQEGWMPVKLLCVGMAPPSWLLAPLLLGASAVGVLPCNTGCPVGQNEVIKGKVAYCQRLLQLLGASAEMVRLSPLLDQPPQGNGKRLPVENLFNHTAIASGLMQFAQAYSAPSHFAFAHPYSPLGVVKVREDVCTGCSMCAMSCPTGALSFEKQEDSISLSFHAALCIACGQCLSKCPEQGAINLDKRTDLKQISQGKTVIYREETARCVACGAPIAPHKMLKRIETLLGSEFTATMPILSRYCLDCRSASAFSGLGKR